jgi:hypothetical protein
VSEAYEVSGSNRLVLVGSDGRIKQDSEDMADEKLLHKWIEAASAT